MKVAMSKVDSSIVRIYSVYSRKYEAEIEINDS